MTKTFVAALAATVALAGAVSANVSPADLENRLAAYPVEVNVSDLTDSERARVALVINSKDSQAEIVRELQSIAK
ncbi:MAG: hypothetical protein AAFQ66_13110 [Pseudomonadota bacterium]